MSKKNGARFVINQNAMQRFKKQVCSYCGLAFVTGQGKCWTATFPNDYLHAHCMVMFKDDQEAYHHGDAISLNAVSVKDKEPIEREIFTKGKHANAKALSNS
jgi:hypothetical protein